MSITYFYLQSSSNYPYSLVKWVGEVFIFLILVMQKGFPGGAHVKEPACQHRRHKRCGFNTWVGNIPWRRTWKPTPVFLPGEFHEQRSLGAGYSRGVTKNQTQLKQLSMHTQMLRGLGRFSDLLHVAWCDKVWGLVLGRGSVGTFVSQGRARGGLLSLFPHYSSRGVLIPDNTDFRQEDLRGGMLSCPLSIFVG